LGEIFTGPAATFCQPPLRQPFRLYAVGASSVFHVVADVSSSLVSPRRSHAYDEDRTNGCQRLYPPYCTRHQLHSIQLHSVCQPRRLQSPSTVYVYGLRSTSVNISILPNSFPVRLGHHPCGVVCLLGSRRVTGRDESEPVPREFPQTRGSGIDIRDGEAFPVHI